MTKEQIKELENKIVDIARDKTSHGAERKKEIINTLNEKYDIPIDLSMDILSFRKQLAGVDEIVKFGLCETILKNKLNTFYTKKQIDEYTKLKYYTGEEMTEIVFNVIQVEDDQWIGVTDVKTLMYFRNRQIIHYNGDTQRALQHVIRHGNEILQPFLNHKAVTAISEQYKSGGFIPNTITLNMGYDTDYSYNEKNKELTIYSIDHFDITDGYHRYVAMGNVFDNEEKFNYPVEIRITMFDNDKAQKFIYQEDQKTKMRKIDSKYMNSDDFSNRIVRKLNESSDLRGDINNKDGIIYAPFMAECINKLYKPKTNIDVLSLSKEIKEKLDGFVGEYENYSKEKWSRLEILTVIYGFYKNISPRYIMDFINHLKKEHPDIGGKAIIKKQDINILNKEVQRYV